MFWNGDAGVTSAIFVRYGGFFARAPVCSSVTLKITHYQRTECHHKYPSTRYNLLKRANCGISAPRIVDWRRVQTERSPRARLLAP